MFTDDQEAHVGASAFLTATSGITSDLLGIGQSSRDVPADLDAMARICDEHVSSVLAQVPSICTVGPVERERGAFGNGESVVVRFEVSCQGTRDQVIGVIGGFSRLSLTERLP